MGEPANIVVYLGTGKAVDWSPAHPDTGKRERVVHSDKRRTEVVIPASMPLGEAFATVTQQKLWAERSDADKPTWVASSHSQLADLLALHWQIDKRDPLPDGEPAKTAKTGKKTEG